MLCLVVVWLLLPPQLFKTAAQQGLPDAQYNLATLHFNGIGTDTDYKLALKYFKLAAQVSVCVCVVCCVLCVVCCVLCWVWVQADSWAVRLVQQQHTRLAERFSCGA